MPITSELVNSEHVIQNTRIEEQWIRKRWLGMINERLTTDRITAYKAKHDKKFTKLAEHMWKNLLIRNGTLPDNWFQNREVLVGSRP